MKRLAVIIGGLLFVLAACGTAGSSPGLGSGALPSLALPSGADPSALASAAIGQLCDKQGSTSLSTTAGELEKVGADTDTSAVSAKLGDLLGRLQQLEVSDTAKPIRDAAAAAVLDLQTSINDPAKRQDAAKKGAEALRAFETSVCS